jgi:fructose-specific phosphotransferase system IIC component
MTITHQLVGIPSLVTLAVGGFGGGVVGGLLAGLMTLTLVSAVILVRSLYRLARWPDE